MALADMEIIILNIPDSILIEKRAVIMSQMVFYQLIESSNQTTGADLVRKESLKI